MGQLIYAANMSLDGYTTDRDGSFDWSEPSGDLHQFFNDLLRPAGTQLYGRRMYETMVYWETEGLDSPVMTDFAQVWRDSDKIIYSTTLEAVASARTRIERTFDVDAVRTMKASAEQDISIGGPNPAAQAIRAGLVDDYHLVVVPVIVGGGSRALPGTSASTWRSWTRGASRTAQCACTTARGSSSIASLDDDDDVD